MKQIGATLPEHSKAEDNSKSSDTQEEIQTILSCTANTEIEYEPSRLYYATKRAIDIVLAIIGIIALLPVFLIVAVCIKLDDGGAILHFREIIGKHGRRFYALKFRTMIENADEYLAKHPDLLHKFQQNMKLAGDPRITRVGRVLRTTSLDELPQLLMY